jgi:hypothetical protein
MLYATGDTHGEWSRFNMDNFPEQKEMTKSDYVLILGDFGIWDGSKRENYWLDWLDAKPWTTLFIEGNHDNADILDNLPVDEWHGGNVHFIRPSVIHLMRGQVYDIDWYTLFTFGGARSHDIRDGILEPDDPDFKIKKKKLDERNAWYRINHKTWWERELPSNEEMQEGLDNLQYRGYKIIPDDSYNDKINPTPEGEATVAASTTASLGPVNFIATHCPPTQILNQMDAGRGIYKPDYLTDYLQQILDRCKYNACLFGHMHQNKKIDEKHFCLYEQIVKIW